MKIIRFFINVVYLILVLVLTIALFAFLSIIQSKLFLPKDYILWVFKPPASRLTFIFEFYLLILFFRKTELCSNIFNFINKHKRAFFPSFIILNLLLIYYVLINVTVVTNNKIIDHTFFSPRGNVYTYNDIVSINAGVYGKPRFPFTNHKGEFFYIIKLSDGTKINLNDSPNTEDVYRAFEELDSNLVNLGIVKTASMANFEFLENNLDKIYSNRIKTILKNEK